MTMVAYGTIEFAETDIAYVELKIQTKLEKGKSGFVFQVHAS
jgi:hypothetical protein